MVILTEDNAHQTRPNPVIPQLTNAATTPSVEPPPRAPGRQTGRATAFVAGSLAVAVLSLAGCGDPDPSTGAGNAAPSSQIAAPVTTAASSTTSQAAVTLAPTTQAPTTTVPAPPPPLRVGDSGPLVKTLQDKLRVAGYDPGPADEQFGPAVLNAVWAFQHVNGLTPDGDVGPLTLAALDNPRPPEPMLPDGPADRVEVSIDRKLLVLYKDNAPVLISHVSSGSLVPFCENGVCGDAVTPPGEYTVIHKIDGWEDGPLGRMFNSVYFRPAYAIHGSPSVPDVGASHGCVRIPMHIAEYFPSMVDFATAIHIQQA